MAPRYPTRIDIPADRRDELVTLLNGRLADVTDLHSQVKQAHWNVRGEEFFQLHELFDELAETLRGHIDALAERATALGGTALGTVRMAAGASSLPEYPVDAADGRAHLDALTERYGTVASLVRVAADEAEKLGDMATNDLFIEVSRDVDKHLWFLEAHLQA